MRTMLLAVLCSFGTVSIAAADPQTCRDLRPLVWSRLPEKAQARIVNGEYWESTRKWKQLIVEVSIDRAPHLAAAILDTCPGVRAGVAEPSDQRRFTSVVRIHVTSYAALARVAQLPAVQSVSIYDPTLRHKHTVPDIMFE